MAAVTSASSTTQLMAALENLSMMLVLQVEEYVRSFSAAQALPQLIQIGTSELCRNHGDCLTLLLRSIALVLESAPDSNRTCAATFPQLVSLTTDAMQRALLLSETLSVSTVSTLAEECLRILMFVVRDDPEGSVASLGFLRGVLGTLDWADANLTKQCFGITFLVCDKIVFSTKQKKTLLSEVIDRLVPELQQLAQHGHRMTHTQLITEGTMQSLGALCSRAAGQGQTKVVAAITTNECYETLFDVIAKELEGEGAGRTEHRALAHYMTTLLHFGSANPAMLRRQLLKKEVHTMLESLLQPPNAEALVKMLLDPFGTSRAQGPQQATGGAHPQGAQAVNSQPPRFPDCEHNVAIIALLSLVSAVPPIPSHCFGRNAPISVLAVRRWLWEDDVHTFTEYPPDQWTALESSLSSGQHQTTVRLRNHQFNVNVFTLKQSGGRNLSRSYVPEFFTILEPGTVDAGSAEFPIPLGEVTMSDTDISAVEGLCDMYLRMVCRFSARASGKLVKTLGLWATAALLHGHFSAHHQKSQHRAKKVTATTGKGQPGNVSTPFLRGMGTDDSLLPLLCEAVVDALSQPEEDASSATALALACIDWLLHNETRGQSPLQFTSLCCRFGIPEALHVTVHFQSPQVAQIVLHAELLLNVLEATSSPVRQQIPSGTEQLAHALSMFNEQRDDPARLGSALSSFLHAITQCSLTSFEFANAGVATALVSFLKGGSAVQASRGGQHTPVKHVDANAIATLTKKQRCQILKASFIENPEALRVMTEKLTAVLPFLCPLPLVESSVSSHAVVPRTVNEVLTILASLSPRMAMCGTKNADDAALEGEQSQSEQEPSKDHCPNGHPLALIESTDLTCVACGQHAEDVMEYDDNGDGIPPQYFQCPHCQFEVCMYCYSNPDVDSYGVKPADDSSQLAGKTFHLLCSVGDVERYFRRNGDEPNKEAGEDSETRMECFYEGMGRCRMQETLLSLMYRKAFHRRLTTVLEQFENSLMRADTVAEQQQMRRQQVAAVVTAASSSLLFPTTESSDDMMTGSFSQGQLLNSPLRGQMFSFNSRAGSASPTQSPAAARRVIDIDSAMRGGGRGISIREFGEQCATRARTFYFHNFSSQRAEDCCCGSHSRRDFATETSPLLRQKASTFELQPEVQLLLLLHEMFQKNKSPSLALPEVYCDEIASLLLRSLHSSAVRVAVLPLMFAVPRWVMFVLREAPFLLPLSIREHVARFACYGAKRALWQHIRKLNLYPTQRAAGGEAPVITPDEWHLESSAPDAAEKGHKQKIRREQLCSDTYRCAYETCELRFPLAIEFDGDIGTGLGPTIQWFSKVAEALAQGTLDNPAAVEGVHPVASVSTYWQGEGSIPSEGLYPKKEVHVPDDHDTEIDDLMHRGTARARGSATPKKQRSTSSIGDDEGLDGPADDGTEVLGHHSLPASSPPRLGGSAARFFHCVGLMLGRAFLDGRVFPLPLSPMMLEWLRVGLPPLFIHAPQGTRMRSALVTPLSSFKITLDDVAMVNKNLCTQLQLLKKLGHQGREVGASTSRDGMSTPPPQPEEAEQARATLLAMDIPFTLPGDDNYYLLPPPVLSTLKAAKNLAPSDELTVDHTNAALYVQRVCETVVFESVVMSVRCFWQGVNDVIACDGLQALELDELQCILTGDLKSPSEPLWTIEEIDAVIVADHGYTMDSPQISFLKRVLTNRLSPPQQRKFLEFCTGCPRLPPRGLREVGHITVVRSSTDDSNQGNAGRNPNAWALPSVNTCFRYLKLPPYPSEDVLLQRLIVALDDCGPSFEFS